EGGQNLIGPELGVGLGLIRTRELLAARGVDGGRQFFTRAYDFGFTRSLDETLRLWPRDVLLEDAVRVIRRFKPQVVVSIFPGVPSPTHGQHQAAGITAFEAFPLAGDPGALPQLAAEGLAPWQPQALYRSTFFDRDATTMVLPTSRVDPLVGRSIYQIAMASRSQHRSQDMGQLLRLGPQETRVAWVQGEAGVEAKDLFAGIDTNLPGIAATVPDPERQRHAREHLEAVQVAAERARGTLNPARLDAVVPEFVEILKHLRAVRAFLAEKAVPEERPVLDLIDEKIEAAQTGLAAAAGVAVDAATEREALTAGETFPVQAVLWASGSVPVEAAAVSLVPSPEWGGAAVAGEAKDLAAGSLGTWELQATVPAQAPPTTPYFLKKPLAGSLYDWSGAPAAVRGEPFGPPPLTARFTFTVDGVPVVLEREVAHRHRDQALGEVRRPLRVVPRVEVAASEELLVWPVRSREPRRLHVTLTSHSKTPLRGRVEAVAEDGPSRWPAVAPVPFEIPAEGEEAGLDLTLAPPRDFAPGRYTLRLAAVLEDGGRFDLAAPVLDYPHVRATQQSEPAALEIRAADVVLPALQRVGYVRGA
ncbi:hypothetical protein EHM82_06655, partial [bacterium]